MGFIQTAKYMFHNNGGGIRAFYRGYLPAVLRGIPNMGSLFLGMYIIYINTILKVWKIRIFFEIGVEGTKRVLNNFGFDGGSSLERIHSY